MESARKQSPSPAHARDAVYCSLTEMAGHRPNYEEALRALYRGDDKRFRAFIAEWPEEIQDYARALMKARAA